VSHSIDKLIQLVDRLRGPEGCPWDQGQTLQTIRTYLIEEAYEAAEALEAEDAAWAKEELGDLLFQVVFACQLFREEGLFDLAEAAEAACHKMIRRHPHVFGPLNLETAEEVRANWEWIKETEKSVLDQTAKLASVLDSLPAALPALLKALRLSQRAAGKGFDWAGPAAVLAKVEEELAELKEAAASEADPAEEVGDLFFALANLARHLGLNPEEVLQAANAKFERRFRALEADFAERDKDINRADPADLESVWERIKAGERE